MAPKKKASEVGGPSASHPPPPEPTVGGGDAVGRVVAGEDTHGAAVETLNADIGELIEKPTLVTRMTPIAAGTESQGLL